MKFRRGWALVFGRKRLWKMARRAHRISFSGSPRFAVAFTLNKFSLRFAELVETPALLTIYFIPEILYPFLSRHSFRY